MFKNSVSDFQKQKRYVKSSLCLIQVSCVKFAYLEIIVVQLSLRFFPPVFPTKRDSGIIIKTRPLSKQKISPLGTLKRFKIFLRKRILSGILERFYEVEVLFFHGIQKTFIL